MKRRRGRWKRKKRRKKGKRRKKNEEGEKEEEEEEKVKEEGFGIFCHAASRCLAHEKLNCIYFRENKKSSISYLFVGPPQRSWSQRGRSQ